MTIQSRYKYGCFVFNFKNYTDAFESIENSPSSNLQSCFQFFFSEKQANILILTEGCEFHPPKLKHRSPESTCFLMGINYFQESSVKNEHQNQTIISIWGRTK